jgi:hypothetical protein
MLRISVPSLWDLVRDVRATVATDLKADDPDLRDAAVMAASELVENAIKYGHSVRGQEAALLELEKAGGKLVIRIRSGVRDRVLADATLKRIDDIRKAPDKHALYIGRMHELAKSPNSGSQLGLYRICSEGGFDLAATIQGDVLQITATRELS